MKKCNTGSLKKFEEETVIRDETAVHIRPLRPADEENLLAFFRSLSDQSKWRRFFAPVKDFTLINEAKREAEVDCEQKFGLIATLDDDSRIIGQAYYVRLNETHADAAFIVADEFQGRGLGTLLLLRLAEFATTRGIRVFEADVMASNQQMLDMFRHSGFTVTSKIESSVIHIEFPIDEPEPYQKDPITRALHASLRQP